MLDLALTGTLGLMGLASVPHCALMCGAPCAAVAGGGSAAGVSAFQAGRVIGYAAAGAVAAFSMAALREATAWSEALRPLWTVLQAALLVLGLWLLIRGQWPAWLGRQGFKPSAQAVAIVPWSRASGAGLLWFAWPCGLLQGALLVAALANSPWGGAAAMASFALASSPGLVLAPMALRRWLGGTNATAWAARLAGLLLVAGAAWALGHGLWAQVVAWCT
jgi:sulfite exporter TauE/SafE